jgi:hypothetical protein
MGNNKITLKPEIVEALFKKQGLEVIEPYINSRTRVKARCINCGKIVQPYYRQIWAGQKGCKDCFYNSLRLSKDKVEKILKSFDLELMGKYVNSQEPFQYRCLYCNTFGKVSLNSLRRKKYFGCSGCLKVPNSPRQQPNYSSRSTNFNEIREEFYKYGFELLGEFKARSISVSVKHLKCGTNTEMNLKSIKRGAGFCKGCMKNRRLTEEEAFGIIDRAGFLPRGKFTNVETHIDCECKKCGKVVPKTVHELSVKNTFGCPYCNKVKIDPETAEEVLLDAGYKPVEPYKNSKSKWKSIHVVCGTICYPRYNSIQSGQGACTKCTVGTFDYNAVSYFYLVSHESFKSFKVGISNVDAKTDRLITHESSGWKTLYKYEFENGYLAYDFEQTLLLYIRNYLNIPQHLNIEDMPRGGFSETFSADLIDYKSIIEAIKKNHAGRLFAGLQE